MKDEWKNTVFWFLRIMKSVTKENTMGQISEDN